MAYPCCGSEPRADCFCSGSELRTVAFTLAQVNWMTATYITRTKSLWRVVRGVRTSVIPFENSIFAVTFERQRREPIMVHEWIFVCPLSLSDSDVDAVSTVENPNPDQKAFASNFSNKITSSKLKCFRSGLVFSTPFFWLNAKTKPRIRRFSAKKYTQCLCFPPPITSP